MFGLAALLLVSTVAVVVIVRQQPACATEPIAVAAAPNVAPALRRAADAWGSSARPDGACPAVRVTAVSSADAVDRFARPRADLPDVWVPDSSQWVQQLRRDTDGETARAHTAWVSPSIASSPMVLAASPSDARGLVRSAAGGWSDVLSGNADVSTMNPYRSTEGLLTLATAQAALGSRSGPPARGLVTGLVTLSTRVVTPAALHVSATAAGGPPAFATSEQTVIKADSGPGTDRLQAVYPRGSGLSLDFPVVQFVPVTEAGPRRATVSAFVSSLYRPSAQRRLRAAGLRDAQGSAFPSTVGFDGIAPTATVASMPQVSDQQITEARRVWSAAKRRNRTLIVVDVSGSMTELRGQKIRFAAQAVRAAVGYLPDDAQLGLWAFSTDLDGRSPWRELVPVGPVGGPGDPQARRQTIAAQAGGLPALAARTRGNTGLYRTVWDAYRAVRDHYDPRRYNSLVLVTDGADTGSGLTRRSLLSRLRAARASSGGPLPVLTVAVGPDADRRTLRAISGATGGAEYNVDAAADIRDVFLDAVIKEGS
jgi:Mg-chelatase subunit ChlD